MVRRVVREERIRPWKSMKTGSWRSGRRSVRVRGVDNERDRRTAEAAEVLWSVPANMELELELRRHMRAPVRRCLEATGDKIRSGARRSGARRSAAANMWWEKRLVRSPGSVGGVLSAELN